MIAKLKALIDSLGKIPHSRQYLYISIVACITGYVIWSIFSKDPQKPSEGFVVAKPAVTVAKVIGPIVKVPIRIVPKADIVAKLPELKPVLADPDEEVIDTADIPPSPNGATSVTILDTRTGDSKTEVKEKPAPWFALEKTNYIGAGILTDSTVRAYYRRDLVRVKDVHIQVEGQVLVKDGVKATAGVNVEYRF